jgi:hypothetical protein
MNDIKNLKDEIIVKNGQKFEFEELESPIDLTEQNEGKITEITHVLHGFEEDLYLIFEEEAFYFGHKVGETGLVVNVEDSKVEEQATEMLFEVLSRFNK